MRLNSPSDLEEESLSSLVDEDVVSIASSKIDDDISVTDMSEDWASSDEDDEATSGEEKGLCTKCYRRLPVKGEDESDNEEMCDDEPEAVAEVGCKACAMLGLQCSEAIKAENEDEVCTCGNEADEDANEPAFIIISGNEAMQLQKPSKKVTIDGKAYTEEEAEYLKRMDDEYKAIIRTKEAEVTCAAANRLHGFGSDTPIRFTVLMSNAPPAVKGLLLQKIEQVQAMSPEMNEYHKLRNWIQGAVSLPLGVYRDLAVKHDDGVEKIGEFLRSARNQLDAVVYGHNDAKSQVMRILAQWVANPTSKGNCIGIHGHPGVGKTVLVKEGICKALGLPFGFVALGGASDASYLEGNQYVYEGSHYGKVANILIKSKCMNPVIFFDELDKVSGTRKGEEIVGLLTHLTDSSQNEKFVDRYFGDIELDLSRALFIFSYNDESAINPILKDRMITIHVDGYDTKQKLEIARGHLVPSILKEFGMTPESCVFSDDVIKSIIQRVPEEKGVRNLKRGIECIASFLNMARYIGDEEEIPCDNKPIVVTDSMVRKYLKNNATSLSQHIQHSLYI